jgi:hypothetical protein
LRDDAVAEGGDPAVALAGIGWPINQRTNPSSSDRRAETGEAAVPVRPAASPGEESGREFRAIVAGLALSDLRSRPVGVGILAANSGLREACVLVAPSAIPYAAIIAGRLGPRPSGRFGRSPAVASEARGVAIMLASMLASDGRTEPVRPAAPP